jgi:thiol-disulfide isomerase/thioredoxin
MSPYIKGAIAAAVAIAGMLLWYQANQYKLPANQSPAIYRLIDRMEKEGVPDVNLARLDGSRLSLSDLKGKIVIVNFWASWCNPCVEEFPSMLSLVKEMGGDVVIYAISTDDNKADIETFKKAFGLPQPHFEVVWDEKREAMLAYGVEKIPESFIVGKDFKLIRKVLGIENWSSPDAIAYFKTLVTGGPAPANASAD